MLRSAPTCHKFSAHSRPVSRLRAVNNLEIEGTGVCGLEPPSSVVREEHAAVEAKRFTLDYSEAGVLAS
jgi:hypothetical protein